jgi:aryl sulfotransferase
LTDTTRLWPQKTRELQNIVMDSTRWDGFPFRHDDIVIATYAKTGTTWMQQIVGQLIFRGAEDVPVVDVAAWIDMCFGPPIQDVLAMVEAQKHRRFLKTHLPLESLVFSPKAKYIYIARDGRDTLWSLYHHHQIFSDAAYEMMNNRPGRFGPPFEKPGDDIRQYFHTWLDGDGAPFWPFWPHIQGWWNARNLPNVKLVHFNNLKKDLPGEMRGIAKFLETEIDESLWPAMVEHCTFDYMKKNGDKLSQIVGHIFDGGGSSFINKGTNGRWRDVLSADDLAKYDRVVRENLTPDCAHWLATGDLV